MADLSDLKTVGEILKPLFADLAQLAEDDARPSDAVCEDGLKAVAALKDLVTSPTDGPAAVAKQRAARSDAIEAVRSALVELRIQAITRQITLTPSQELLRSTLVDTMKDELGRIAQVTVFQPLTQLLQGPDFDLLKVQLEGAEREIAQRERAKLVLDTMVDVAIAAGKIAAMLV